MVRDLERQGLLRESAEVTARLTSDAMYELTVEKKLLWEQAWELVREEWAFPPERGGGRSLASTRRSLHDRYRAELAAGSNVIDMMAWPRRRTGPA